MSLPASLLAAAEAHACFTGCYSHETPVALCIDAARPTVTSFHAACQDCMMFQLGALANLLPPGMTQYGLAQELAAHMRSVRGYRWAISGYHATGPGFWLSAAYYGDGLFLVDGSRNHGGARDVDLLVKAFQAKLVQPDDQGMLDPALYASEVVHLSCSPPITGVKTKQDIVKSSQCSLSPRQGLRRACIVQFLPLTTASYAAQVNGTVATATPAAAGATPAPVQAAMHVPHHSQPPPPPPRASTGALARGLKKGQKCSVCGAMVEDRKLFIGSYVGCLCG